jgi:predicted regulator of Ras-like GTPase activity (Roadblock/LC7/MglB family)
MMLTSSLAPRPVSGLRAYLEKMRRDLNARLLLATDGSGRLVEATGDDLTEAATMAALGAANLAATQSLHQRMARELFDISQPHTLITESPQGSVVMCGRPAALTFLAVLTPDSLLGLARLQLRHLAEIDWVDALPAASAVELAQEFLGALDSLMDDL